MDFPLLRCTEEERAHRESTLHELLRRAKRIGASRVVLPFVDASSIRTEEEKSVVLRILERALSLPEDTGVEMHLEADFNPADFAQFLARIPHAMIKVNYDTGNSSGLGYVAREEFAAYGDRIGSIHIKYACASPKAVLQPSRWVRGVRISMMSSQAFARLATPAVSRFKWRVGKTGTK